MAVEPITVREWTDVVRRARLGRTRKAVALMLATYADSDGTRVFPGIARLAVDCELGYNVVQEHLTALREIGLIELVRAARRRGDADEYRLALGPGLLDAVDVMSPAAVALAVERMRTQRRGRYRGARTPPPDPDLHPTRRGAEDADDTGAHPTGWVADNESSTNLHPTPEGAEPRLQPTAMGAERDPVEAPAPHGVDAETRPAPHGVVHLHPTPLAPTYQDLDTTTTEPTDRDLRTAVTVSRATGRRQDPISGDVDVGTPPARPPGPSPSNCPTHPAQPAGHRPDGKPRCVACRAAANIGHADPTEAKPPPVVRPDPDAPLARVIRLPARTA